MLLMLGLVLVSIVLSGEAFCQGETHLVRGTVSDASTGQRLVFATVSVENSRSGTTTNDKGEFTISLPRESTSLLVSYAGYGTAKVRIAAGDSVVAVKLTPVGYLLQDVSVYARPMKQEAISTTEIQNQQVRDLAGMTKDPLRAAEMFPGVSVDNEKTNRMSVRGGTPGENLVLINGVEIYEPNHLKMLANTSISIFNIDMVKRIDFSAGGFGVKYGDGLSSMMRINYREGDRKEYRDKLDLNLLDVSGLVEGPIDSNSSFIVGFRKSYIGYLKLITSNSSTLNFGYYDLQGQIDYHLNPLNKLRVDFIYSNDNGSESPSTISGQTTFQGSMYNIPMTNILFTTNTYNEANFNYSNTLLSVMSANVISDNLINRTTFSLYDEVEGAKQIETRSKDFQPEGYSQYYGLYSYDKNVNESLLVRTLTLNEDLNFQPLSLLGFDGGLNIRRIYYDDEPKRH